MPEAHRNVRKGSQILDIVGGIEDVRAGAGRVFPVEPVRTLDALHLTTALLFAQALPGLRMPTFDERIEASSRALGIA